MTESTKATMQTRELKLRKRAIAWSLFAIVTGALALPLGAYVYEAMSATHVESRQDVNPRARYWREVRQGAQGYTAVRGQETNILIQNGGQNWRQARNGLLATLAPWLLASMLASIAGFYLVRGQLKLEHRPSGYTVQRWNAFERFLHWYVAILFILLAVTGLSLLLGRAALLPLLGPKGFAAYAALAKNLHNYLGPFFSVGIFLEIVIWIRYNIPSRIDLEWFKKFGGMTNRGNHPSAGRMNGGEKVWFWIITTVGTAVIVSGFVLDFPNFGQTRQTMQMANLIHAALAVLWISIAFGHIYIGTIGTEGALEGMTRGRVSVEWAKQHHDLWYEELKKQSDTAEESSPDRLESPGFSTK